MKGREDNGPYGIYAETEITVEFFDLDPLNVVWHGNYLKYFEIGRRALLEEIKFDYLEMQKTGYVFPIIECSVKYLGFIRFRDRIKIKAILVEYENRLKIKYEIHNAETGLLTTKGITTQMAYNMKIHDSCFVCPQVFVEKIEACIKGK